MAEAPKAPERSFLGCISDELEKPLSQLMIFGLFLFYFVAHSNAAISFVAAVGKRNRHFCPGCAPLQSSDVYKSQFCSLPYLMNY